jgi:hypothetical protein
MKILFLIRNLDVGGAEKQMILLSKGLADLGHQVSVAVFYPGKLDGELSSKVQLIKLNKSGFWDILKFFNSLQSCFRKQQPDVVYSYLVVPNLLAGLMKLVHRKTRVVWGIRSSNALDSHYKPLDRISFFLPFAFRFSPI